MLQGLLVRRVNRDPKARQERMALPAWLALTEPKARLAHRVRKVSRAQTALPVPLVPLALKVRLALRVSLA